MIKKINIKNKFSIIMYHQIIKNNKFNIHGLNIKKFEKQISYFKKNLNILNPKEFYKKIDKKKFKRNDCILTFDDGYKSHFQYVLPILNKYSLNGFFFPIAKTIKRNELLDINKIHLILGKFKNKKKLLELIKIEIKKSSKKTSFKLNKIISKISVSKTYDNKTTIIIKRLLQKELPEKLRKRICKKLFNENFKESEKKIAKEFYLNLSEIKNIKSYGNEIGSHSFNHLWMNSLNSKKQLLEIKKSLQFWRRNKIINKRWSFCYPYGAYNRTCIKNLKKLGCSAAFLVQNKVNKVNKFQKFNLNRVDCNQIKF
tara:strand:- start:37 stop:975 length:939 start_codon:yes stop_codon:yes gene_type:complete